MGTPGDRAILNVIFNPLMPVGDAEDVENVEPSSEPNVPPDPNTIAAMELEAKAVEEAEAGNAEKSLELMNEAVAKCPTRPDGYNNRAQTLRLMGEIDKALDDLNEAIRLSEGKGNAACQALCQRALILRLRGQEEAALADFEKAAALGSLFAKTQAAMLNPYAAMCNKMLGDMIGRLQRGEPENQEDTHSPA